MVRYLGIQNPRHHINLIEINSCFRKYSKEAHFGLYRLLPKGKQDESQQRNA